MKKIIVLAVVFALFIPVVTTVAKESLTMGSNAGSMEDNLLFGLSTNNPGLQRSCALLLGKMQSYKAVIPLLAIFSTNQDENVRIAAAWALCKIGDSLGYNAVKLASQNDDNSRVKEICVKYLDNIEKQGIFSVGQPD